MNIILIIVLGFVFIFSGLTLYSVSNRWFKTHRPWHPLGIFYLVMMWISCIAFVIISQIN